MTGGKTTIFEAIFHCFVFFFLVCSVLTCILLFILISTGLYQKLMNTN